MASYKPLEFTQERAEDHFSRKEGWNLKLFSDLTKIMKNVKEEFGMFQTLFSFGFLPKNRQAQSYNFAYKVINFGILQVIGVASY